MAITLKTAILGAKVYFARDGADDASTPVSSSHKPAANAAVYLELGHCESGDVSNKVESIRIKRPSPGRYRLAKTIPVNQEIHVKMMMQEISEVVWEAIMLSAGALTIGTAAQPMKQSASITGWLNIVLSDQADTDSVDLFLWAEISVKGYKFAEKEYKVEVDAELLDNSLNTVKVASLT